MTCSHDSLDHGSATIPIGPAIQQMGLRTLGLKVFEKLGDMRSALGFFIDIALFCSVICRGSFR